MDLSTEYNGTETVYVAPATDGITAITLKESDARESNYTFNEYRVPSARDAETGALLEHAEFTGNVID